MKILVTGASGFVGRYLCHELVEHGHEVIGLGQEGHHQEVTCDITDAPCLEKVLGSVKPDAVIHLAGIAVTQIREQDLDSLYRINVEGTFNLCRAFHKAGGGFLLYVSSGLVYGHGGKEGAFSEGDPIAPPHAYAASKVAAEQVVSMYRSLGTLTATIARPFNHIGAHQSTQFVVPALAERIAKADSGTEVRVGNLETFRDFTDVRDIVQAYRLIVEQRPEESLFVLGSGQATRIGDIFDYFVKRSGKTLTIRSDASLSGKADPGCLRADPRLAKKILGWEAKYPLSESLEEIYRSFSDG